MESRNDLFGVPVVTNPNLPKGTSFMMGDILFANPETVAVIVDTRLRYRLLRAWGYIKKAWREVFPRRNQQGAKV